MKLLRSGCCYRTGSGRKRRRGRGSSASDRDSGSGSEEVPASAAAVARQQQHPRRGRRSSGGSSNNGGSKRRQRATYRYEVVYRREEFSHDYLDQHGVQQQQQQSSLPSHPHAAAAFRHSLPEEAVPPRPPPKPLALLHQSTASADYSLLSNYGQLDELRFPPNGLANGWPLRPTGYDQVDHQPLYQNAGTIKEEQKGRSLVQ